jgi:hypothetical protein
MKWEGGIRNGECGSEKKSEMGMRNVEKGAKGMVHGAEGEGQMTDFGMQKGERGREKNGEVGIGI